MAERYYASYKSLFRIKWKIYSIGDKPLPRPIPVDWAAVFFAMLPPAWVLARPVAALFDLPLWAAALAVAGALTWAAGSIDPQGRPMAFFLADAAAFFARNRRRDFAGRAVFLRRAGLAWECVVLAEEMCSSYE